jgi:hypothetical protein
LHGGGTVAGLRVEWVKQLEPGKMPSFPRGRAEEIVVAPGIAVDRLGRVIEVPASACIRLARWYEQQPAAELFKAFHPAKQGDPANVVVVDVFIRFYSCERGKTPAFATGPFDALDAVQPSRMREFYKLELVAREHDDPDLLKSRLPIFRRSLMRMSGVTGCTKEFLIAGAKEPRKPTGSGRRTEGWDPCRNTKRTRIRRHSFSRG